MNQFHKMSLVLVVVMLGIWGCAQGPSSAERVKSLEAKVTRLEEDFRAAAAARDQFRKKLGETEQLAAQLKQDLDALQPVIKERDDLRVHLKTRTQERDTVAAQFDGFRKSLKELVGQMEAIGSKTAAPSGITTVSQPKGPSL